MQATAGCHQLILNVFPPQAKCIFDNPAPFHTANHMLDPHPHTRNPLVLRFLVGGQRPTAWFFLGLFDADPGHAKALKAQVLIQDAVGGEVVLLLVGHRFIMPTPFIGRTQKTNVALLVNQQHILHGMLFVFPAIVEPLFISIAGSVDGAVGAVVEKRDSSSVAAPQAFVALIVADRAGNAPCTSSA